MMTLRGKKEIKLIVSSQNELSSKFRTAEESHLWFNLGKGSSAMPGVHLRAQTQSLHTESRMREWYFWEVWSLDIVYILNPSQPFCGSADSGFV